MTWQGTIATGMGVVIFTALTGWIIDKELSEERLTARVEKLEALASTLQRYERERGRFQLPVPLPNR